MIQLLRNLGWFRQPKTTAVVSMTAQPLLVNPDALANLGQKKYRLDAIQRYVNQRKLENRPIPSKKLQELVDEKEKLELEVRALEKQIIADGGVI